MTREHATPLYNLARAIYIVVNKKLPLLFLDPEGGSPDATLVVVVVLLLVLGISSLKIPKAFLLRSGAQRNFAHTF